MPKAKKGSAQSPIIYSQPNNNILYVMMGVITLFLIFLTVKVITLEKKIASGNTGGTVAAQQESSLSVKNLKIYAKELGLNTGKFNKCLDSNEKKTLVDNDIKFGSSVGIQGTPGFFINGQLLAGAFPFQFFKEIIDKQIAGTASSDCTAYSTDLQKYCSDPQNKAFDPVAKNIELGDSSLIGNKNAKVSVVEFSDFECTFCIRAYPTVKQILSEYKNDVKLYFKQFPLTNIHPNAQKAAEASLCALDQGKFWQMHDKLFGVQQNQ